MKFTERKSCINFRVLIKERDFNMNHGYKTMKEVEKLNNFKNISRIGKYFECNDKTRNELDKGMIIALFDLLYKREKITKKEYDSLISKVHRTHYLNE